MVLADWKGRMNESPSRKIRGTHHLLGLHDGALVVVEYRPTGGPEYRRRTIIGTIVSANCEELHVMQTGGYREGWFPEVVTLDFGEARGPIGVVKGWASACCECGGSGTT